MPSDECMKSGSRTLAILVTIWRLVWDVSQHQTKIHAAALAGVSFDVTSSIQCQSQQEH